MKRRIILLTLIFVLALSAFAPEIYAAQIYGPGSSWEPQSDGGMRLKTGNDYVKDGWLKYQNRWYLFSSEGYMLTGWQPKDGFWYYLSPVDTAEHPLGSMYENCITPDGLHVNESGALTDLVVPQAGNPHGYTCVDVNLTTQTVTVYQGFVPVLVTACVTGRQTATSATTPGKFAIYSKQTDRYLQGLNDDGTKYKSFVHYWMPFNGGQGLHDASWRGSFGGTIYVNNGSHGCVNLPPAAAQQLFSIAYVGMPVVVHN